MPCAAQVEGIFSGTLSYIFNSFVEGTSFSGIVAEAKAAGYTEPDPRDDLAGMDVARKVTILARCVACCPSPRQPAQQAWRGRSSAPVFVVAAVRSRVCQAAGGRQCQMARFEARF